MFHFNLFPVAFGEADVSERIKHGVSFQKPKKSMSALCVLLCAMLTACLSTNPEITGRQPDPENNPAANPPVTDAPQAANKATTPANLTEKITPEEYFSIAPDDPAALRNPLQKETKLRANVQISEENPSEPLILLSWDFGTIARPLTSGSYTLKAIRGYLKNALGAIPEDNGYYLIQLTAEKEILSFHPETGVPVVTYSCVKETPEASLRLPGKTNTGKDTAGFSSRARFSRPLRKETRCRYRI